jgi:UDP-N-acetylmuramoylalanine--D-glutamate ligase
MDTLMIERAKTEPDSVNLPSLERVKGRKVGVIGMARSGLACAALARKLGADVFVSEAREESALDAELLELNQAGATYETGGHTETILASDYVIVSPGVPADTPIMQSIHAAGTPVFSELEFASWFTVARIMALTGANGKTTTATMIHKILQHGSYTAHLCGNIGIPFSSIATELNRNDVAVIEVSSYQLEFVDQFAPEVAAILNVTPDHLSRHKTFENYRLAKLRITEAQEANQSLILNADDSGLDALAIETSARRLLFGSEKTMDAASIDSEMRGVFLRGESIFCQADGAQVKLFECRLLKVPGRHNIENAMAAASCCLAFGVPLDAIREGLLSFSGVEHRIENVATINDVQWVNDSKATNLAATICALEAFESPVRLILGGQGKGEDFRELQSIVSRKVRSIVALGETKEEVFAALGKTAPVEFATTLEGSVLLLARTAQAGEVVLLSPGCASFDMFADFEERGNVYKGAVKRLAGKVNDV